MKKLILILMSANFMAINTIQLISCGVFEKNNSEKKPKSKPSKPRPKPHPKPDPNKPKPNKPDPNKPKPDNENTNYIVDYESTNKPLAELSIPGYRGWAGTLNDKSSMDKLVENKILPYESFNSEQLEFIKKFTTVLNTPASKKSIEKFNKFHEAKTFKTFDELVNTINTHNKDYPDSYIDVPLELIRNHAHKPAEFEEIFLKVYNTLSAFLVNTMDIRL